MKKIISFLAFALLFGTSILVWSCSKEEKNTSTTSSIVDTIQKDELGSVTKDDIENKNSSESSERLIINKTKMRITVSAIGGADAYNIWVTPWSDPSFACSMPTTVTPYNSYWGHFSNNAAHCVKAPNFNVGNPGILPQPGYSMGGSLAYGTVMGGACATPIKDANNTITGYEPIASNILVLAHTKVEVKLELINAGSANYYNPADPNTTVYDTKIITFDNSSNPQNKVFSPVLFSYNAAFSSLGNPRFL